MQPWLAALPMESSKIVPCMPYIPHGTSQQEHMDRVGGMVSGKFSPVCMVQARSFIKIILYGFGLNPVGRHMSISLRTMKGAGTG
jgi:hypothetical protein